MARINGLTVAAPMAPKPAPRVLLGVARQDVTFGQVFRRYNNDGTLGDKKYGAIGKNGRFYSINLVTGEVAAADDGSMRVKVVGSYVTNIKRWAASKTVAGTRARLHDEAVFRVKGGKKLYANLGRLNDGRYIGINTQSADYALAPLVAGHGDKGNKRVEQVGTFSIDVTLNAGER